MRDRHLSETSARRSRRHLGLRFVRRRKNTERPPYQGAVAALSRGSRAASNTRRPLLFSSRASHQTGETMGDAFEPSTAQTAAAAAGFSPQTTAERRLIAAWSKGAAAQLGDAAAPSAPDDRNQVRAGLVAFLARRSNDPDAHPSNRFHMVGAYVTGAIDLAGQHVRANLIFQRCRFAEQIVLSDAVTGGLDFNGSRIGVDPRRGASLDARHLKSIGDLRLRDVVFEGGVALSGAEVRGDLDISGASFGKRRTNFHGYAYEVSVGAPNLRVHGALTLLRPPADGPMFSGVLNLHNAEVDVLQDDPACWPAKGCLFLNGFRYRQLGSIKPGAAQAQERGRWLLLQPEQDLRADFKPQPFEQLARVLRMTGHALEARRIGVLKQRMLRRAGRIPLYIRPFHWVFGLVVGYGYWTSRVLLWALLVVALGAGLFEAAWRGGAMTPAQPEVLVSEPWAACAATAPEAPSACWASSAAGRDYEPFDAALYSLDLFLPLIQLEQEAAWSPSPTRGPALFGVALGSWAWGYRFFHELLGYVLSGFAAVGFAKLAERD